MAARKGASMQPFDTLSEAPDRILAERAADGDVVAFEALARRYGPRMRVYAMKLLGSDFESDDVVQEAFIHAWAQLDRLTDPGAVRPWLMRMVGNRAIERIRKRKKHLDVTERSAPAAPNQNPERIVEMRMQWEALSSAVQRLPQLQRLCWVLKEIGGISYAEIAEQLDEPVSTVRGQLARARHTLIQEMGAWR